MKTSITTLLFFLIAFSSFSQPTYEQRLAMAQNKESAPAKDIRYLLHHSSRDKSDAELIEMLESIKMTDAAKKNVSIGSAFTLRRYELAKHMTENGYGLPTTMSSLFSKPFSDGVKNSMQPSNQIFTDEQMMEYMNFFAQKGMEVDVQCINYLEIKKKLRLKQHAISLLTPTGKTKFDEAQIIAEIRNKTTDYTKVDSILAQSEYTLDSNFLFQFSMFPLEKIKEIRAIGGNINSTNSRGDTFLMACIKHARPHIVSYLINDPEINLCATNKRGENVLYYLKSKASGSLKKADNYKSLVKKVKATCKE